MLQMSCIYWSSIQVTFIIYFFYKLVWTRAPKICLHCKDGLAPLKACCTLICSLIWDYLGCLSPKNLIF